MITNLGCQFDIYRKRESQLHNCFYKIGLWACLWSTFWIAKWSRWFSLHQLAEWFHESHRAEAFPLPGEVTVGVKSWYTVFFLFILMLVITTLHFSIYTKTGVNIITYTLWIQYDNKLIVVIELLFTFNRKFLLKIFMSTVFASSLPLPLLDNLPLKFMTTGSLIIIVFHPTPTPLYTRNLLSPFSVAHMHILGGLTTWVQITYNEFISREVSLSVDIGCL